MASADTDSGFNEAIFRIGAVSKATRIPAPTLRMWERRYGVVKAHRSDKHVRLYSRQDVARLTLIKQLVDLGNAISTVANLDLEQLQSVRSGYDELPGARPSNDEPTVHAILAGDALAERYRLSPTGMTSIIVAAAVETLEDVAALDAGIDAHVLVIDIDALDLRTLERVLKTAEQRGIAHVIILYGFAAPEALSRASDRLTLMRRPIDLLTLERLCTASRNARARAKPEWLSDGLTAGVPPRRFDGATLERIASSSTTIKCECPHHLVELVRSLAAFEKYSEQCENRNAADAALHVYLHEMTARARAMMEEALDRVAQMEKLL
jgi:DNA-binding transcriptional MerR regulator